MDYFDVLRWLREEEAVFGFGKKKLAQGGSASKTDRYTDQKDNEAMWGTLSSAKEESNRQAKRGGF